MRLQSPTRAQLGTAAIIAAALCAAACSEYTSDAGPEHCGAIGTEVWGRDLNPHDVSCDVTISGSLTIGPGTRIRFAPGTSLIVQGSLFIEGTAERPVQMEQADDGRGWVGIWVRESEDDVQAARPNPDLLPVSSTQGEVSLQHVEISGAGITPEGGAAFRSAALIIERGPVDLHNVTISDARQCGMSLSANGRVGGDSADVTITNSIEAPICSHVAAVDSLPAEGISLDEGAEIDVFGEALSGSHTWHDLGATYRITESFQLAQGELTVEAGTDLRLFANTRLTFGGSFGTVTYGEKPVTADDGPLPRDESAVVNFAGTADAPITVDVEETLGEGSKWDRIRLVGTSSNSVSASATFSNVSFRNGGAGVDTEPATVEITGDIDVTMTDVTIEGGGGAGLLLDEGAVVGEGSSDLTITGNAYPVVTHADGALSLPESGTYTGNSGVATAGAREGGDFIYVFEGSFSDSGTLADLGVPYRLDGDLGANGGPDVSLTIEDGVSVLVPEGGEVGLGTGGALALTIGDPAGGGSGVTFGPIFEGGTWNTLTLGPALDDDASSINGLSVVSAGSADRFLFPAAVDFEASNLKVTGLLIDGTTADGDDEPPGLNLTGSFSADSSGLVVRNAQGDAVLASTDSVASIPKAGIDLTANGDFSHVRIEGVRVGLGGTWSNLGVPYRIGSLLTISGRELADGSPAPARVVVEPGVTFEIEPRSGVSVKAFESSTEVKAYGTLVLDGTAEQPITFKGTDPEQGWANLDFNDDNNIPNPADRSLLDHVIIEDAGAIFAQAALEFWDASPPASNVTIRDAFRYGVATLGDAYISPIPRDPQPPESVCDVWDRSVYTFDNVGKELDESVTDKEHIEFRVFIKDCDAEI